MHLPSHPALNPPPPHAGGTLDTKVRLRPDKYKDGIDDAERNFGRESRSLKACHEFLYKVGGRVYVVLLACCTYSRPDECQRHEAKRAMWRMSMSL